MKIRMEQANKFARKMPPDVQDELLRVIEDMELAEDEFCARRGAVAEILMEFGFPKRGLTADDARGNVEKLEAALRNALRMQKPAAERGPRVKLSDTRKRGRPYDMRCPVGPSVPAHGQALEIGRHAMVPTAALREPGVLPADVPPGPDDFSYGYEPIPEVIEAEGEAMAANARRRRRLPQRRAPLHESDEWYFEWVPEDPRYFGGYNSVRAETREEAVRKIREMERQLAASPHLHRRLVADLSTLRPVSQEEIDRINASWR